MTLLEMNSEDRRFAAYKISQRMLVKMCGVTAAQIEQMADVVWPKCAAAMETMKLLEFPLDTDTMNALVERCRFEYDQSEIKAVMVGVLPFWLPLIINFIIQLLIQFFLNKQNSITVKGTQ